VFKNVNLSVLNLIYNGMMYNYFIGIDISKDTLEFCLYKENKTLFNKSFPNSNKGIQTFIKEIKTFPDCDFSNILFCMEHTGIYNNHLLNFLIEKQCFIWLERGAQIKHSLGIQRGKNDKIDAERIAIYAYKNRESVKLWAPPREIIQQLRSLASLRSRLLKCLSQLSVPLKESKLFSHDKKQVKLEEALCKSSFSSIKKDLDRVNEQIHEIIIQDPDLNRLFNIITSVDGIGAVTAAEIIITTNEFKNINEAKKYACYSGVAPFDHTSGSSIRGKSRVSHLANKTVKQLLHLCAMTVIQKPGELQEYYLRKVKEGKNKMLILNAIRNKLILRIFSCIRENRPYQKKIKLYLVKP
jgi:transposase